MIKYAKESFINRIDDIILNQEPGISYKTFWQVRGVPWGKNTSIIIPPLQKQDGTFVFTNNEKASISTVDDANIELPNFNNRSDVELIQIQVMES